MRFLLLRLWPGLCLFFKFIGTVRHSLRLPKACTLVSLRIAKAAWSVGHAALHRRRLVGPSSFSEFVALLAVPHHVVNEFSRGTPLLFSALLEV